MRTLYILAAALVCAALAFSYWFFFMRTTVPLHTPPAPTTAYANASSDVVVVELPFPGAVTGKTFSVIGEARGYWFFEASFPIEVRGADGALLTTVVAQAQSDWMTEDFVPFTAQVTVPESYMGPATVVLKKDNPSGLPKNDASVSFPITVEY